MKEFSFTSAWALGIRFFSGAALNHAILLIGLGVVLPVLLQILLLGRPLVMISSAAAAGDGAVNPAAVPLASVTGFVLQTCSFFASWRLGLARGETLRGALVFGLPAGLVVSVGFGLALVVLGVAFGLIAGPVAAVAVLIGFVGLFAIAWTAFAALFAVAVCLFFLLALAFGAAIGDLTYAATIVGGGGFVWSILVAAAFVLLWLAARLSCTAMLMSERKSFNLPGAIRESWSLTWDDEWRITRYLALLGLAMALVMAGAVVAAGASAGLAASLGGASQPAGRIGGEILLLLLPIPLAYLAVLVPAGIYRELAGAPVAAEVFA